MSIRHIAPSRRGDWAEQEKERKREATQSKRSKVKYECLLLPECFVSSHRLHCDSVDQRAHFFLIPASVCFFFFFSLSGWLLFYHLACALSRAQNNFLQSHVMRRVLFAITLPTSHCCSGNWQWTFIFCLLSFALLRRVVRTLHSAGQVSNNMSRASAASLQYTNKLHLPTLFVYTVHYSRRLLLCHWSHSLHPCSSLSPSSSPSRFLESSRRDEARDRTKAKERVRESNENSEIMHQQFNIG